MADLDILYGHGSIATFLNMTTRQVIWHDEQGNLPTYRMGRTVCARKSKLLEWIEEQEEAQRRRRSSSK